ncbi:MAG: hypothetical protein GY769_01830 [bacterium]|nr:hypothetical protein [bacterium]
MAAALTTLLAVAPAAAKKKYSKVKGQVVTVEQRVMTTNGGEHDRLTIRTRDGEQIRLNLGKGGACEGCYRAGDQVRARIHSTGEPGAPREFKSMEIRRDGKSFGRTNANGEMIRNSGKGRPSAGDRVRDRVHEPGSAGCSGCDSGRHGGAGQGTGGGSRVRGGN